MAQSLTNHAAKRAQQRCVPPIVVDWLWEYGQRSPAGQGAECLHFDKTSRRALQRTLGGWAYARMASKLDAYAIVGANGQIVTTGYRTERLHRL